MGIQRSVSGGEISPLFYAGADLAKYSICLRTLRNAYSRVERGATGRAGTEFVASAKLSADFKIRPIPFIFNSDQTYLLEFGHLYMRVYRDGAPVVDSERIKDVEDVDLAAITNQLIFEITSHGYEDGESIILQGLVGLEELNGREVIVSDAATDTFRIKYKNTGAYAVAADFSNFWTAGGTASVIYEIETPYQDADLAELYYDQSGDVVKLTRKGYFPRTLTRLDHDDWTLEETNFGPPISGPDNLVLVTPSGNPGTLAYQVTSVDRETGEESVPGGVDPDGSGFAAADVEAYELDATANSVNLKVTAHGLSTGDRLLLVATTVIKSMTSFSCAGSGQPIVFGLVGHGYANGDAIHFNSLRGGSGLPPLLLLSILSGGVVFVGNDFVIANVTPDSFELVGVTGVSATSYSTGVIGTVSQPYLAAYNGIEWIITVVDPDNFTLNGASTAIDAVVSQNTNASVAGSAASAANSGDPDETHPNILTWDAVVGAMQYRIYRITNGLACFIGASIELTFSDTGFKEDTTDNPPAPGVSFSAPGDQPGVVSSYQSRTLYSTTENAPDTIFGTRAGVTDNMSVHVPGVDDDAIVAPIRSGRVNEIRHMIDLRKLVILTAGSEMIANGDSAGNLSQRSMNVRTSSYNGASKVRPLLVNNSILYVQANNSYIRDLGYEAISDGMAGKNRSVYSRHLFDGHTIVDSAFQQTPDPIGYFVRDDGILLGLTYLPEEEMFGWHWHDTDGLIEYVLVLPEGGRDVLYWVVKRTVNGVDYRYIERQAAQVTKDQDIKTAVYMDSALIYDGRHTDGTVLVKLQDGVAWVEGESMTAHASVAGTWSDADVGKVIVLRGDTVIRCTVTAIVDDQNATVTVDQDVPVGMQGVDVTVWDLAVTEVAGLDHLEGKRVHVLGDGFVVADANDQDYDAITVTNGRIQLPDAFGVVVTGLPYLCDYETLDVDSTQARDGTLIPENKIIVKAWFYLYATRGLWVGAKPPADDEVNATQGLRPVTPRDVTLEDYVTAPALFTGRKDQDFPGHWNSHGRLFARQTAPLPWTIEAILPEGDTDD